MKFSFLLGAVLALFLIFAFFGWLIMLAAGALGFALGFWGAFPLGILFTFLVGGVSKS